LLALARSLFDPGSASSFRLLIVLGALFVPSVLRLLFALLFREVSGSPLLVLAQRLAGARARAPRLDASVLPLTREAFWARLAQKDRQQREPDGNLLVTATLAHLDWDGVHRLQSPGGDSWLPAPLPPLLERGRLLYRYRLAPLVDDESAARRAPEPPHARAYQDQVLEDVAREWDDLLLAGSWLVALLPAEVQQRAFAARGGPRVAAGPARRTAVVQVAVGGLLVVQGLAWTGLSLADALSLGLLLEGALRYRRAARGEYAPSLLGFPVADLLRPERVAYHAHRDAERRALLELASSSTR
jgi:hypothetical protein